MDYFCDSFDSVASGIGQRVHDWRVYSYPPGRCHRCSTDPGHPGTENIVANWNLAGEGKVLEEGGGQQAQKEFAECLDAFGRKDLATNHAIFLDMQSHYGTRQKGQGELTDILERHILLVEVINGRAELRQC